MLPKKSERKLAGYFISPSSTPFVSVGRPYGCQNTPGSKIYPWRIILRRPSPKLRPLFREDQYLLVDLTDVTVAA